MIKAKVNSKQVFEIDSDKQTGKLLLNGTPVEIDLLKTSEASYHIIKNNRSYNAEVINVDRANKLITVKVNNSVFTIELTDRYDELMTKLGFDKAKSIKPNDIKAPMPGLVKDIFVTEGQQLKEGDAVLILEAMKMENVLKAPADTIVKSIKVEKGVTVEKNEVIVVLG